MNKTEQNRRSPERRGLKHRTVYTELLAMQSPLTRAARIETPAFWRQSRGQQIAAHPSGAD